MSRLWTVMYVSYSSIKLKERDFPDGTVVKTLPSNTGGTGKIHGQGGKIPHASWPKNQNVKQNIVKNSIKAF